MNLECISFFSLRVFEWTYESRLDFVLHLLSPSRRRWLWLWLRFLLGLRFGLLFGLRLQLL